MLKFSANLSFLYQELGFLDRFAAAAKDGFGAVEYLGPYAETPDAVAKALRDNGLVQALFNVPSGNWAGGERGIACLPERVDEFRTGVRTALDYAAALNCPKVNVISGLVPAGADMQTLEGTLVENLKFAADLCAKAGVKLLIEPINTRDIPGFLLNTQADAHAVIAEVGEPNLKVQMDLYHCQIVEGDLAMKIRKHLSGVGHVQIAGVPERHEPDLGELNYPYLFALLDELGYEGWIGCEYRPRAGTSEGLGWLKELR